MAAAHCKAAGSAPVCADQETILPWNDASKPAEKPGPWDAPVQGERGATPDDGSTKGRGRPGEPRGARSSDPSPPWGREEPAQKLKTPRRPSSTGRKTGPQAPAAPPSRGPHLDQLSQQVRTAVGRVVLRSSGKGVRAAAAGGVLAVLVLAWGLGGVYEVGADETGMVTRFGAFVGETGPGLHYHLPAPIEVVHRISVGALDRLNVAPGGGDAGAPGPMLTRDGQLAVVTFDVRWRVTDPYKYLFQSADPEAVLRHAAEAALREAAGQASFADMTSSQRGGVTAKATALLQDALRRDDIGVSSADLQIRDVEAPDGAQAGFHDMAAAREDARIAAGDVGAYRDRVLSAAKGDAAKAVQASQASRDQEISEARGEAARFALVDAQYRKAPDVTRDRLYTEMMERVLHNTPKVIVQAPKGSGATIVLPSDIFRSKAPATPATAAPSQVQPQDPAGHASDPAPADSQTGPTA